MGKQMDVVTENRVPGRSVMIGEIGSMGGIDITSERVLRNKDELELEAFMNEYVEIMVHPTADKSHNRVVVPEVNGTNQPIIRGVKQKVRRKFVEALARATDTNYDQRCNDPVNRDRIEMVAREAVTYPFSVYGDSDRGAAWLNSILQQQQ
jgi:hypothetical protein